MRRRAGAICHQPMRLDARLPPFALHASLRCDRRCGMQEGLRRPTRAPRRACPRQRAQGRIAEPVVRLPAAGGVRCARRADRGGASGRAVPGRDQAPDPEKVSAYECGFNPFDDARMDSTCGSIWSRSCSSSSTSRSPSCFRGRSVPRSGVGFWSMMMFLGVLTIGFIYEWNKGALEWD